MLKCVEMFPRWITDELSFHIYFEKQFFFRFATHFLPSESTHTNTHEERGNACSFRTYQRQRINTFPRNEVRACKHKHEYRLTPFDFAFIFHLPDVLLLNGMWLIYPKNSTHSDDLPSKCHSTRNSILKMRSSVKNLFTILYRFMV